MKGLSNINQCTLIYLIYVFDFNIMNCHCTNLIKFIILDYINKNNNLYPIDELIDIIYELVKKGIDNKELELSQDDLFIKNYINSVIHDMADKDKNINIKSITDDNKYYYMKVNKEEIKQIFKSEKKEDKEREEKIKMLIEKRKKLDELKRKKHQSELTKVLHRYNDLKDLSQELLGRIAVKKNITVKELYTELDISEDED